MSQNYFPPAGITIEDACKDAVKLAYAKNTSITFDFNGVSLTALNWHTHNHSKYIAALTQQYYDAVGCENPLKTKPLPPVNLDF